jgi:hypothetical protein
VHQEATALTNTSIDNRSRPFCALLLLLLSKVGECEVGEDQGAKVGGHSTYSSGIPCERKSKPR